MATVFERKRCDIDLLGIQKNRKPAQVFCFYFKNPSISPPPEPYDLDNSQS